MGEVGIVEAGVSVGDGVMVSVGVGLKDITIAIGVLVGTGVTEGGSSGVFVGIEVDTVGVNVTGSVPSTVGVGVGYGVKIK